MNKLLVFILLSLAIQTTAQNYASPLDIPLLLSANCGELRGNHFHSGIDIKTQGVTGKPVYSIEDGFVSRIGVSPGGYGLAIYVDHPSTGHTSVYGHLERYAPQIANYVKAKQYEKESFEVDLRPNRNQFPVKKGQIIAYSGNTGSSGGPHVHFEIRDAKTQRVLDPLVYYKDRIADTKSPDVRGIAVYPVPGRGIVNGSGKPLRQSVQPLKDGGYSSPKEVIEAWGTIGLGIKSYDRMNETSNIYGVKKVSLFVDNKKIFESYTKEFGFDETRMINTFTDFEDWKLRKSFFMQSFIEPGNKLPFYTSVNNGYIDIKEERAYNIRYELEDLYGNKTSYGFNIEGKKREIPTPSGCSMVFSWNHENRFVNKDFKLIIPQGSLYNDQCFKFSSTISDKYFSSIYKLNDMPIPLHKWSAVSIKIDNDVLKNKKQYGIVQIANGKESWIGGTYENGFVTGKIRELGLRLAVSSDTQAPTISPILPSKWESQGIIKIKVTDNLSGVASIRGTIDGKYVLFTYDIKSNIYQYKIDSSRMERGKNHKFVFKATDGAGNTAEYSSTFVY